MFVNFGKEDEKYALAALRTVREAGIAAEIYPDSVKMGKQMSYANAKHIPFVVMAGENERTSHTFTCKNMTSGEQQTCTLPELIEILTT